MVICMSNIGVNLVTVRIDDSKCSRCYECMELCPTNALSLDKGIFVHNSYECSYCEVCMDICPEEAIQIFGDVI